MFHFASWKLLQLTWRGRIRQFWKGLHTYRGLFQFGFVIAVLAHQRFSWTFAGSIKSGDIFHTGMETMLAAGLCLMTCYQLLFATSQTNVYFTPGEIAFLFPAPLTRQQLLTYALLKSLVGISAVSAIFTMVSSTHLEMMPARWLALVLTFAFLQLFTMAAAFSRKVLQVTTLAWIRNLAWSVIVIAIGITLFQMPWSLLIDNSMQSTEQWISLANQIPLLIPFRLFARSINASDWPTFISAVWLIVVVDVSLLVYVYRADAMSLELSATFSEKMTAKLKRAQQGGAWQHAAATSAVARRRIPQLPFWGGIGPVLWQRASTTIRSSFTPFVIMFVVMSVQFFLVFMIPQSSRSNIDPGLLAGAAMAYVSLIMCLTSHNSADHFGYLKSLPLSSLAIVLGETLSLPIMLSVAESICFMLEAALIPAIREWLWFSICLTLPINFLFSAIDKLVFIIYPTRPAKGAPGDFQAAGAQMIYGTMKMLAMFVAIGIVVVLGVIPGILQMTSPSEAAAASLFLILLECAALVPLLKWAFDRFDPNTGVVDR